MKTLFTLGACLLFVLATVHAQDNQTIAYSWRDGNVAFAYPAAWSMPVSETTPTGARLLLHESAAASDGIVIEIEFVNPPSARPFDLMAERLASFGLRAAPPFEAPLAGITALETTGADANGEQTGIARGTFVADERVLLVVAAAPAARGTELLAHFDTVANSLVASATQMPLQPDGTLYTRMGSERLMHDVAGYGSFTLDTAAQMWTFDGAAGDMISLYATDINRSETLNLRLRLIAPEGTQIAENDNHSGGVFYGPFSLYDAVLSGVVLPIDGVYTLAVEAVFGDGVYSVGVASAQAIALSSGSSTRVQGRIDDAFAAQSWTFAGSTGQVYTITMLAGEGTTLDTALRLYAPDGALIDQNDDTRDTELGTNAQLAQVTLPQDGIYRLEATRYAGGGTGVYELIIVPTG
ncbi:MAG: PPC domain-containing protein [Chloroflexota bacterium]|nr:PPC domain-containing protein [Chloroflexota bacterium]